MFLQSVLPLLSGIVRQEEAVAYLNYRIVGMGESYVEEAVVADLLAISGIELGYCARMGEVDLRVIGSAEIVAQADAIIARVWEKLFSPVERENLETVIVRQLDAKKATLAVAESCTGGFLAHRLTNVPGASRFFWPVSSPIPTKRRQSRRSRWMRRPSPSKARSANR